MPTAGSSPFLSSCTGSKVQGYLAYKKQPTSLGPPWGPRHNRTVGPEVGPRSALFIMSEVLLYIFFGRMYVINKRRFPSVRKWLPCLDLKRWGSTHYILRPGT